MNGGEVLKKSGFLHSNVWEPSVCVYDETVIAENYFKIDNPQKEGLFIK